MFDLVKNFFNSAQAFPPNRGLVFTCVAGIAALTLACSFDSPERARGSKLIEDLERKVEDGITDVRIQQLIGNDVELVCLLPPYASEMRPKPFMTREAEDILRRVQRTEEVQNDIYWGLLAIDDSKASKYRLFLVGRKERGFRGVWDDKKAKSDDCVRGSLAVLSVSTSRTISIREGEK